MHASRHGGWLRTWSAASCALLLILLQPAAASALDPSTESESSAASKPVDTAPPVPPLHARINDVFAKSAVGPVAGRVSDSTFARRIYLDLLGRIPTADELRSFLNDASANKRSQLVDRLLADDDFPRHLAVVFDVMLMERRGDKYVKSDAFRSFLEQSFRDGKPFHQLAAELIAANTSDNNTAAAFFLERDAEPNLMTREIGRVFFGRDIQCAQCHDHPNVDDYKQEEYYGLFAFVNRSSLFQPDKKKPAVLSEAADGQAPFKSVFTERQGFTLARLPGEAEVIEEIIPAGDEYKVRPSKTTAGVPTFSRRQQLAELIGTGTNEHFRRNIANRLWAIMMGRGLVHPVDMHHSSNPPSNPAAMKLIADEFAAMNFDVPRFLRELALTEVYQRSHQLPASGAPTDVQRLEAKLAALEAEQQAAEEVSNRHDAAAAAALEKLDEAIAAAEPLRAAWEKARAAATAAAGKLATAETAEQAKRTPLTQKQTLYGHLKSALENAQAAAELLGESKELQGVVTGFTARSKTLDAEISKLTAELKKASAVTAAAVAALEKANAAEQTERDKFLPLQQVMHEHRTALVQNLSRHQRAYETVAAVDESTEYLQQIIQLKQSKNELPQTAAALQTVSATRQQSEKSLAQYTQAVASVSEELQTSSSNVDRMKQSMQQLTSSMNRQQEAQQYLLTSVSAVKEALALVDADELNSTVSTLQSTAGRLEDQVTETSQQIDETATEIEQLTNQIQKLQQQRSEAQQAAGAAREQMAAATAQIAELKQQLESAKAAVQEASAAVIKEQTARFQVATVQSLTPEQLAWSILYASGQVGRQQAAELAKLNKAKPLTAEQQQDAAAVAARNKEARTAARIALEKQVATFVKLFGSEAGQPQDVFFATVDQALFFANGGQIRSWLSPSGDNLTGRLLQMESAADIANELYLSTLVRPPATEEVEDVKQYLAERGDQKRDAVQELAWALITSAEFRFQY
ncbi:MAG: hypothetical protein Fues2KO_38130 [Fuerstiella sp.]